MPMPVKVSSMEDSHSGNNASQVLSADLPSLSAAWYSLSVWWERSSFVVDGLKLKLNCIFFLLYKICNVWEFGILFGSLIKIKVNFYFMNAIETHSGGMLIIKLF